jgi:beta-glucosidase
LALKVAHEAIILLKNQDNFFVSEGKIQAHRGDRAERGGLASWRLQQSAGTRVSVLQGIKDKVGTSAEVLYSEGTKITETPPDWDADKVVLGDPALNAKRIQEAVKIAQKADAVKLALGGNEQTSREAWAPEHKGDRDSLDLLGNQDELVKAILATGKPTIVFLQHGRPNSINYIAEHVPAILDGWYLGQEGAAAVADVLFGDYNPGGHLPITVPRSVGQLPDYYYQKPSAKREFVGTTTEPLFPFGWGLSYSTFKYANVHAEPEAIGVLGSSTISVEVTNTGKVRGDEVVQLYIRQEFSSVTRPVKELRGFRRLSLEPGESKTVKFTLGPDELAYLNRDMHRVVEREHSRSWWVATRWNLSKRN